LAGCQDSDIFQHRLATIAEARGLYSRDLQAAAQLVDDERGQGLTLDVFHDDQQRTPRLHKIGRSLKRRCRAFQS
jgi:hypothetical protein